MPSADGAWLRWILAFVPEPQRLLASICAAVRPGGRIVVQEYFAYETWQLMPEDTGFAAFVRAVIASWRSRGGEPNVGLAVPGWLEDLDFRILGVRAIVGVVTAEEHRWLWPTTFALSRLARLLDLGDVSEQDAVPMRKSIDRLIREGPRMITPAVIEVIAEKKTSSQVVEGVTESRNTAHRGIQPGA